MAKRCTTCLEWKESGDFYRDRSKLDGLKSQCKDCLRKQKRDYRQRKRARSRARLKRVYKRIWQPQPKPLKHRIVHSEGFHRWKEKHAARRRKQIERRTRQWHINNQAQSKRWHADNPQVGKAAQQSQRAKRANIPVNDLSADEWQWLVDIYEHRCAYCGDKLDRLSPDHVVPLANGGHNTLSNIVPACNTCNRKKSARTPKEAGMSFAVNVNVDAQLQQRALL